VYLSGSEYRQTSNTMVHLVVTSRASLGQGVGQGKAQHEDGDHLALPFNNSFSKVKVPVVSWLPGWSSIFPSSSSDALIDIVSVSGNCRNLSRGAADIFTPLPCKLCAWLQ